MSSRPLLAVVAALVACVAVFVATQGVFRELEVAVVVAALSPFTGDALLDAGSTIVVTPTTGLPFLADVRPSCSALGAIVALTVLGSAIARRHRARATAAAIAVVLLGNLVRIGASLAVGVVWGRSSLVLFHDAAGGAFTFAYLLVGFGTYLYLTLPEHDAAVVT